MYYEKEEHGEIPDISYEYAKYILCHKYDICACGSRDIIYTADERNVVY